MPDIQLKRTTNSKSVGSMPTNFDKIKEMNIDEMTLLLEIMFSAETHCGRYTGTCHDCPLYSLCLTHDIKQWLESEAK